MSNTLIHGEAYNSTQNGSIVSVNLCVTSAISDNVPTVDIDYEQNTEGQPDTTHTVRPAQTSTKNDTETQPLAQRTATSRTHKADKDVRTFGQRKRQLKDKIIPTRQLKTWKDSATSGIPSHPEALISIVWQEHKGASIIAKDTLYPGDVATRYDTNHEWTKEEFNHRYPQPWNTLTSERRQELDYALFNRHMQKFVIGTPTPYDNPRGVGQFINCATPQTNERNNCKFICNKGGTYITVTKTIQPGQELLMAYNRKDIVHHTQTLRPCPPTLTLRQHSSTAAHWDPRATQQSSRGPGTGEPQGPRNANVTVDSAEGSRGTGTNTSQCPRNATAKVGAEEVNIGTRASISQGPVTSMIR